MICRRSRLVGRPLRSPAGPPKALRSAICATRRAMLSSLSIKSLRASSTGPRRSESAVTVTLHSNSPTRIESASPTLTSFDGLIRSSRNLTLPATTAACASARVLKKRAAHNHLSMRTRSCGSLIHSLRRALLFDETREHRAVAISQLARVVDGGEMQLECAYRSRRIGRVVAECRKQRQSIGFRRHAVRRIAPQAESARGHLAPRKERARINLAPRRDVAVADEIRRRNRVARLEI